MSDKTPNFIDQMADALSPPKDHELPIGRHDWNNQWHEEFDQPFDPRVDAAQQSEQAKPSGLPPLPQATQIKTITGQRLDSPTHAHMHGQPGQTPNLPPAPWLTEPPQAQPAPPRNESTPTLTNLPGTPQNATTGQTGANTQAPHCGHNGAGSLKQATEALAVARRARAEALDEYNAYVKACKAELVAHLAAKEAELLGPAEAAYIAAQNMCKALAKS